MQNIPHAVHFCIGGRGGTLDAFSFVESVSQQLLLTVTGFKDALSEVQASLSVQNTYTVHQHLYGPVTDSEVTGIIVRGVLSPAKAFDLHVRRPMQTLSQRGRLRPVVVLIDGLDESLASASGDRDEEFIKIVSQARDLSAQVRFILTSKPDPFVRAYFEDAEFIEIEAEGAEQREDICAFLNHEFQTRPGLREAGKRAGLDQDAFVTELAQLTEFNFLYLTLVLPQVAEHKDFNLVRQLPRTLNGYYRQLLTTRIGGTEWQRWGAALAQVLLAIQEPASLKQLAGWLKWDKATTRQRLSQFSQLLDSGLSRQNLYWRHHWAVAGFLLDETEADIFLCDNHEGHNGVADYYLAEWRGLERGLPTPPRPGASTSSDKYAHRHLSRHLRLASETRREILFKLVDNRRWYEAQREFDPSGVAYIEDLFQAWRAAGEDNARRIECRSKAILMGREVRCAPAIASLRSGIPGSLLAALVKNAQWSFQEALNAARNIPSLSEKARALLALAPHSDRFEYQAIKEALEAADAIYEPWEKASVRAEAAVRLPPQECRIVLEESFRRAGEIGSEWQLTETLASLGPYLPEDLAMHVLDVTQSRLEDPGNRLQLLLAVAPHVWRGRLLAALVPCLPPLLLAAAQVMAARLPPHREDEVNGLVASCLAAAKDHDGALAAAGSISIPWRTVQALAAIVPHLPPSLLPRAFQVARSIRDSYWRAAALAELVDSLPQSDRESVLHDALAGLKHGDEDDQACAIAAFNADRVHAALARCFVEVGDYQAALRHAASISNFVLSAPLRVKALEALAPQLPDQLLDQAVALARETPSWESRLRALIALTSRVGEGPWREILDKVPAFIDPGDRVEVLVPVLPFLTAEARLPILRSALEAAAEISGLRERERALRRIAPNVQDALADQDIAMRLYRLWRELLHVALLQPDRKRKDLLQDIGALAPIILDNARSRTQGSGDHSKWVAC